MLQMRVNALFPVILALACGGCLPEQTMLPGGFHLPARLPDGELRLLEEPERATIREAVAAMSDRSKLAHFLWARYPKNPGEIGYYCGQVSTSDSGVLPFVVETTNKKGRISQARLLELPANRFDIARAYSVCVQNGLNPLWATEPDRTFTTVLPR